MYYDIVSANEQARGRVSAVQARKCSFFPEISSLLDLDSGAS